jgi:5'-methylthioadenosine phosphorylase
VRTTAERIGVQRPASQAHTALRDALMTPADQVPAATRRKLDLLTEPYWGSFKG